MSSESKTKEKILEQMANAMYKIGELNFQIKMAQEDIERSFQLIKDLQAEAVTAEAREAESKEKEKTNAE